MYKIIEYTDKYLTDITEMFNLWDDVEDLSENQIARTINEFKANTSNRTFLALDENGTAIGYLFCGTCYYLGMKLFLEIMQLMIKEEYRGKGVGKQLMNYVTETYYRQGIRQLRLHSRVILTKAHAFYEKLGFVEFKQSKFFVKNLQ